MRNSDSGITRRLVVTDEDRARWPEAGYVGLGVMATCDRLRHTPIRNSAGRRLRRKAKVHLLTRSIDSLYLTRDSAAVAT